MKKSATAILLALGLNASLAHAADAIPTQQVDQALHDRLPEAIKQAGKMISVNNGSFPPL
ncbi:hypothetical protein OJE16_04340 [Pantoea tagorei]